MPAARHGRSKVRDRGLSLTPFSEHESTQGEPEPERPDTESAHRGGLAPRGKPLPPAEGLLLVVRQGLAATLFAHGAAGAQAEVEIVEDLGRFVRHVTQCTSLLRRCPQGSSTSRTCTSAQSRSPKSNAHWAR